jgi:hypothetical protein
MSHRGDYHTILRIIGKLLDEARGSDGETDAANESTSAAALRNHDPQDVNIVDHGDFIALTWRAGDGLGSRSLTQLDILELVARAQQSRGTDSHTVGGWEGVLRTLGQLLDAEDMSVGGIFEEAGRFHVSGLADGQPFNLRYTKDELSAVGQLRRLLRDAGPEREEVPALVLPDLPHLAA